MNNPQNPKNNKIGVSISIQNKYRSQYLKIFETSRFRNLSNGSLMGYDDNLRDEFHHGYNMINIYELPEFYAQYEHLEPTIRFSK